MGRFSMFLLCCMTMVLGVPRVQAQTAVTYQVTFESIWSATTHPANFPPNPHFSGLIGATHDASVTFWEVGSTASPGIENMAERGSKFPLNSEIEAAKQSGTAGVVLDGGGIGPSPGSVSLTFVADTAHPLVTLVSMIAPSPDWFVGVAGLPLHENGQWKDQVDVELYVYDAGTDSGPLYTSADQDTNPKESIARIEASPFQYSGESEPRPVGFFRFVLQVVTAVEDAPAEVPETHHLVAAYPNPFNPQTIFTLTVRERQPVQVGVFDLTGRRVALLHDGPLAPSTPHRFTIEGSGLRSGLYFYRVEGSTFRENRPILLIK